MSETTTILGVRTYDKIIKLTDSEVKKMKQEDYEKDGRIYEYTSAANPDMAPIPVLVHPAELHQSGPTRVIPFDLKEHLKVEYPATSPNLLASWLRIVANESLETSAVATSQVCLLIYEYIFI